MSEKTYDGLCVGGPYDGQRLNVPRPVWEVATIPPIPVHMFKPTDVVNIVKSVYYFMPFYVNKNGEHFFFWRHESLKDGEAVMTALVNSYRPLALHGYDRP